MCTGLAWLEKYMGDNATNHSKKISQRANKVELLFSADFAVNFVLFAVKILNAESAKDSQRVAKELPVMFFFHRKKR
jgi:hypothetical protein